jgi:CheY-like chemotaxis protein
LYRPACKILVADDSRDTTDSWAMLLTMVGHDVRTASDGEEAVEVAQAFRPDVVLLDIGMPRLNGYDAARRIRQEPWGSEMVLVACSGWAQEEDRKRSHEAGFNVHFVKPLDLAVLQKLLAELTAKTV